MEIARRVRPSTATRLRFDTTRTVRRVPRSQPSPTKVCAAGVMRKSNGARNTASTSPSRRPGNGERTNIVPCLQRVATAGILTDSASYNVYNHSNFCQQKRVKFAYHVACEPCATVGVCVCVRACACVMEMVHVRFRRLHACASHHSNARCAPSAWRSTRLCQSP